MADDHSGWLAELADRHGRMVFATAYRILGNADDAEDALQEVFLKMLRFQNGAPQTEAIKDWGAYLRVTASSCAVDLLRRRSKHQRKRATLSEALATAAAEDPCRLAGRRETADLLRRALAELPPRDAAVFALRHFEGLSYGQVAEQMELTVDHVGVILHRARKRLHDILQPIRALASCDERPPNNVRPNNVRPNNVRVEPEKENRNV